MAASQTQIATRRSKNHGSNTFTIICAKPPARSTRTSQPLLSYTPQIPRAHPDIDMSLLRNKLVLVCRQYVPPGLLHEALANGIHARASRWVTPASQAASKFGKRKRYFILHAHDFTLQPVGSAWEARVGSGSQPIDAGNGVVLFVKERSEWDAFIKGYRREAKRAGQLMRLREKETEQLWREKWKKACQYEGSSVMKEQNVGPMFVLVKTAIARIDRGEA